MLKTSVLIWLSTVYVNAYVLQYCAYVVYVNAYVTYVAMHAVSVPILNQ